jgi:hypothetical protein
VRNRWFSNEASAAGDDRSVLSRILESRLLYC